MATSGIITQDALSVLHDLTDDSTSGLVTQQTLELLYTPPTINDQIFVTQNLVQVAIFVAASSGIVTQDSLSVLHDVDPGSGLVTQQTVEVLYNLAEAKGPSSGIVTQDSLSVLHDVNEGSGLVTQQAIEVLYLPTEFLNTQARVTQQLVQVAIGTGIIPLLQSGVVTQDSVGVLHNINTPSGRFTQNFMEVLYSSITGSQISATQDSVGVLHNIATPSGRFTQNFLEILYSEAPNVARNTQNSLGVLQSIDTSGRFTQNFMEVLYSRGDIARFTQDSLGVLQSINVPSGRFTQNFMEILYSSQEQIGKLTQDSISVLQSIPVSGRFTQNFMEVLYTSPPSITANFNLPVEKLQEVVSVNPDILLTEATLNDVDFTDEAKSNIEDDVPLLEASPEFNDFFSYKGGNRFDEINIDLTTLGDWDGEIDWQYWDGTSYSSIPNIRDRTDGFRQQGLVSWPNIMDMGKHEDGTYEVRSRVSIFTSLTTQPLASTIDLSTDLGGRGKMPAGFVFTEEPKETKVIDVDCKNCNPNCNCGPCCCKCSPPSGGNQYFRITFPDCFTRELLTEEFQNTGLERVGQMEPTGLPNSLEDCYSRLGLTAGDELNPNTVFVWSGDLCTYTDANDCWRLTWGCGISNNFPDENLTGCDGYELLLEVLKCSGQIFTPCDNGDNLGNVDIDGTGGSLGSEAFIPTQAGFLSGCSCELGIAVYTGIRFNNYLCRCCENPDPFTINIEIDSLPF